MRVQFSGNKQSSEYEVLLSGKEKGKGKGKGRVKSQSQKTYTYNSLEDLCSRPLGSFLYIAKKIQADDGSSATSRRLLAYPLPIQVARTLWSMLNEEERCQLIQTRRGIKSEFQNAVRTHSNALNSFPPPDPKSPTSSSGIKGAVSGGGNGSGSGSGNGSGTINQLYEIDVSSLLQNLRNTIIQSKNEYTAVSSKYSNVGTNNTGTVDVATSNTTTTTFSDTETTTTESTFPFLSTTQYSIRPDERSYDIEQAGIRESDDTINGLRDERLTLGGSRTGRGGSGAELGGRTTSESRLFPSFSSNLSIPSLSSSSSSKSTSSTSLLLASSPNPSYSSFTNVSSSSSPPPPSSSYSSSSSSSSSSSASLITRLSSRFVNLFLSHRLYMQTVATITCILLAGVLIFLLERIPSYTWVTILAMITLALGSVFCYWASCGRSLSLTYSSS